MYFSSSVLFYLQCARQGFALGLTMLVGMVPSIKLESLLKLITTLLEVSSSMKGQVSNGSSSNGVG